MSFVYSGVTIYHFADVGVTDEGMTDYLRVAFIMKKNRIKYIHYTNITNLAS